MRTKQIGGHIKKITIKAKESRIHQKDHQTKTKKITNQT
jgi:hypothetical protein